MPILANLFSEPLSKTSSSFHLFFSPVHREKLFGAGVTRGAAPSCTGSGRGLGFFSHSPWLLLHTRQFST